MNALHWAAGRDAEGSLEAAIRVLQAEKQLATLRFPRDYEAFGAFVFFIKEIDRLRARHIMVTGASRSGSTFVCVCSNVARLFDCLPGAAGLLCDGTNFLVRFRRISFAFLCGDGEGLSRVLFKGRPWCTLAGLA